MKDKMVSNKKFIFTQISAPIVCAGTVLGLSFAIGKYHPIDGKNLTIIDLVVIFILFVSMMLSMYIWGRVLVLFKILTPEEAKGYPYSKPWETSNRLKRTS